MWQRLKDPTAATNYVTQSSGLITMVHNNIFTSKWVANIVAIYTNFPWATLPNDWLIISIIRMIGVQMIYNDFNYETGFPEPTMILNTTSNGLRQ